MQVYFKAVMLQASNSSILNQSHKNSSNWIPSCACKQLDLCPSKALVRINNNVLYRLSSCKFFVRDLYYKTVRFAYTTCFIVRHGIQRLSIRDKIKMIACGTFVAMCTQDLGFSMGF